MPQGKVLAKYYKVDQEKITTTKEKGSDKKKTNWAYKRLRRFYSSRISFGPVL